MRDKTIQIITAAILFTLILVAAITIITIRHAQAEQQGGKTGYHLIQELKDNRSLLFS